MSTRSEARGLRRTSSVDAPAGIGEFIKRYYRHFNAAVVVDAAEAWDAQMRAGNRMLLAMAGAMSTAEIGRVLAELIRKEKVHAISCTGANLEEDLFNAIAGEHYRRVPGYRNLSDKEELELLRSGYNRVTDTCIPETVMNEVEASLLRRWDEALQRGERKFPHEFLYEAIRDGEFDGQLCIDREDSWLIAAAEKGLPIFVPGWEDSSLGNKFAALCIEGKLRPDVVKTGVEYMIELAGWYRRTTRRSGLGFFQIGGGIAGDFAICVVPLLSQDLRVKAPLWTYFCQISDSTTSYGSYSGAVPNEKITWGKLGSDTPRFVIESDATIVFPLIAGAVLGW